MRLTTARSGYVSRYPSPDPRVSGCLPPSYLAFSHSSVIIFAISTPMTLAPKARTLESLCILESFAVYGSLQTQQRIPFTLLQAREMPTPVPQMASPKFRLSAGHRVPHFFTVNRVVAALRGICAVIDYFVIPFPPEISSSHSSFPVLYDHFLLRFSLYSLLFLSIV